MKRGGKRKGAGRPTKKEKREKLQITLPPELFKRLKEVGNPSDIIEAALLRFFGQ